MTAANKKVQEKIQVSFDAHLDFLEINVDQLNEKDWDSCQPCIQKVEDYIKNSANLTIVLRCGRQSSATMRFVMRILKMAERYQWAEQKNIKVYWNFDVSKPYREWLG